MNIFLIFIILVIINERIGKFEKIRKNNGLRNFLEALKKEAHVNDREMMSLTTIYVSRKLYSDQYDVCACFKDDKFIKSILKIGTKLSGEKYSLTLNNSFICFVQPKFSSEKIQDITGYGIKKNCFQFKKHYSILECFNIIEDKDNDEVECISTTEKATYIAFFNDYMAEKYFKVFELNGLNPFRTSTYLQVGKTPETQSYKKNSKKGFSCY